MKDEVPNHERIPIFYRTNRMNWCSTESNSSAKSNDRTMGTVLDRKFIALHGVIREKRVLIWWSNS